MKTILLVADLKKNDAINGGYFQATESIKNSLFYAKKQKQVKSVTLCDFREIRNFTDMKFDICLIVCNPNSFIKSERIFRNSFARCKEVYLHILWETDPLPLLWDSLWSNDFITGFFTPSNFFKNLIEGVSDKPIFYTPYAMSDFKRPVNTEIKKQEKSFSILVMGQVTKRKGIEDAITSYVRVFSENENNNSALLLKCFQLSKHETPLEEMIIRQTHTNSNTAKNCKIFTITEELNREEIFDLYSKSSILLSPSRGEGFNLPVMEAMSVGLPVIYVDWSNTPEIVNPGKEEDNINIPLDYYLDEAIDMRHYGYDYGSSYAIPTIRSTMNALATKYNEWHKDKEKYYKNSSKNIDTIKKYFSLETVNNYYDDLFNNEG